MEYKLISRKFTSFSVLCHNWMGVLRMYVVRRAYNESGHTEHEPWANNFLVIVWNVRTHIFKITNIWLKISIVLPESNQQQQKTVRPIYTVLFVADIHEIISLSHSDDTIWNDMWWLFLTSSFMCWSRICVTGNHTLTAKTRVKSSGLM